ncbi:MAG: KinB signaling pathway activation protein [Candidatus Carbobacillus altaicus]|uniref:KinB signaling pathway activation protein n=1 Tax=Candidatus Carbonibacillus altaicus TaxID=2163959 RepID=A0A2R6Y2S8_9BACL|nr:MAG: KinB signaling pathway activation protein [Candidatus Carbobacillus altaicus]
MNTRRLVFLLWSTLAVGGVGGIISASILMMVEGGPIKSVLDALIGVVSWFGSGMVYAALSLLGYFVFNMLQTLGLSLFPKPYRGLWSTLLLAISFIVLVDLLFYPVLLGQGYAFKVLTPLTVLALLSFALIITYLKVKQTGRSALAPTLFFMFVFTLLELIPALRLENMRAFFDMALPLSLANAYQVLIAGRIFNKQKE